MDQRVKSGARRPDIRYENLGSSFLALLFLFCSTLFARDNTDVIVMKNGDRMTCEIKGLSAGVLSVKLSYAQGIISVQWSAVAHLESNQLFFVKTEDGKSLHR